ncbi:GNAT family N-acetyltransferase [Phenylobacterium sp.]|uniref:GNAT family N-acetyltransferase n=1 Tax=Phenylobacterium sp. TaxID=1871053 RepID=UPI002ED88CA2
MVQLVRIADELPIGFEDLRAEADAEGHRHMSRLAQDMAATPEMFTALLAAFEGGELVGVGGLTVEPQASSGEAYRMRRLYVAQRARRSGVARAIANALLSEALNLTRLVTVHAGNPGAERFWEALGFDAVAGRPWTHEFRNI